MNEYRFWPLIRMMVDNGELENLQEFISLLTPEDIAAMRRDVDRAKDE